MDTQKYLNDLKNRVEVTMKSYNDFLKSIEENINTVKILYFHAFSKNYTNLLGFMYSDLIGHFNLELKILDIISMDDLLKLSNIFDMFDLDIENGKVILVEKSK